MGKNYKYFRRFKVKIRVGLEPSLKGFCGENLQVRYGLGLIWDE